MTDSRQPLFLGITFTLLALSFVTVALRFYCRGILVRSIKLDDWLMLAATIMAWGLGIENYFHVRWGTGRHLSELSIDVIVPTLKHWYWYQLVYPIVLCTIKLSILAFYHRIFPDKKFQRQVYAATALVLVYTIVMEFVNAFECPDPRNAWVLTFPAGCNNLAAQYYAGASFNIVTDLVILLLPIPTLLKLQLPKNKRNALIGIFSVGAFAVIASMVRIQALWLYQNTKDVSYDAIFILMWSQIEINISIITSSTPALKPLFKSVFKSSSVFRSTGDRSGDRGTHQRTDDPDATSSKAWASRSRQGNNSFALRSFSGADGLSTLKGYTKHNESEEEIIEKEKMGAADSNAIVRTREVTVQYDDNRSGRSLDEEHGIARPQGVSTK